MKRTNYDLEERAARFGENIIGFLKSIPITIITRVLIGQLVRSAISIGANYMEANHAYSKKYFCNKVSICTKEANETKHWLRMLAKAVPEHKEACRMLWKEAQELTLIFATVAKNAKLRKTIVT